MSNIINSQFDQYAETLPDDMLRSEPTLFFLKQAFIAGILTTVCEMQAASNVEEYCAAIRAETESYMEEHSFLAAMPVAGSA